MPHRNWSNAEMPRRRVLSLSAAAAASLATMAAAEPKAFAAPATSPLVSSSAVVGTPTSFNVLGTTVAGTLFRPSSGDQTSIVVMAHGFGLRASDGLAPFAEQFIAAGAGVLTFDYRSWGASGGQPRQIIDPWAQLEDWRVAIHHARSVPWVNPDRVVLWGTSFAGGHVLHLGAEDRRLAGVISQVPHVNAVASASTVPATTALVLSTVGSADSAGGALGLPPQYLPVTGRPGDVAFISHPGAFEAYQTLTANAPGWRNEVAARVALQLLLYSPDLVAAQSTVPTFIGLAANDQVTPIAPARLLASQIGATLREYAGNHFDAYQGGAIFEQLVADEVVFLRSVSGL